MSADLLVVEQVSSGYGGEDVVHDVSLSVAEGETVAIIGSNGAGKTTLFKTLCGLHPASGGSARFDGTELLSLPAQQIARLGLAYVPAERHLFPQMTVKENLSLGAYPKRSDEALLDRVFSLFPRLAERLGQRAGTMSGGEQQMLAVGRALMSKPRLLLLDEPTTGLAPKLAAEAYDALAKLGEEGLTIVVAEQQVPLALELAERASVLENGRVELSGTSAELAEDPDVRRAYLGVA